MSAKGDAALPAGWHLYLDPNRRDKMTGKDLKFVTMGTAYHVTTGPAGTYWSDKNAASGTVNAAIVPRDAAGKATNTLSVGVGTGSLRFIINGKPVGALARAGMVGNMDGVYGFRVNHNSDIHIDNVSVKK